MIKWYKKIKNSTDFCYEEIIRDYVVSNFSYKAVAENLVFCTSQYYNCIYLGGFKSFFEKYGDAKWFHGCIVCFQKG
ncbi:MAG: hypothetical protein QXW83_01680 [Nitrososphaerales archaeon]